MVPSIALRHLVLRGGAFDCAQAPCAPWWCLRLRSGTLCFVDVPSTSLRHLVLRGGAFDFAQAPRNVSHSNYRSRNAG